MLQIVELLNIIYCLAELLEFAAFIRLRITAPDMKRYASCLTCRENNDAAVPNRELVTCL